MPLLQLSSLAAQTAAFCGLNGVFMGDRCQCDFGWRGEFRSELSLVPASPSVYGLRDETPTWGGTALFEAGHWHLIVGSLAVQTGNLSLNDYPCNSKIVRAMSAGEDPAGPYKIVETMIPRSSWEPMVTIGSDGTLLLMFYGNITDLVPIGSPECLAQGHGAASLLSHTTYITVSSSGSPAGPWTTPQMVRGMENRVDGGVLVAGRGRVPKDPCSWRCASGNPGPPFHPNGTVFAAMRSNACLPECATKEHIALWRADNGWDGEWTLVSDEPVFGWGNATARTCTKSGDDCLKLEDPYLWIDERGWHMLAHYQNNEDLHKARGSYGVLGRFGLGV